MSAPAPLKAPSGGEVFLREFVFPDDYAEVIQLWETAGPGIHVRRSDRPEEIAKKLQRDPDLFLVAVAPAGDSAGAYTIVGSVLGGFDGRRGIMYHLAVSQDFRQRGVGALLMDELERRLRLKGCIKYYLLVTYDNVDAQRFYEKRGWERMELYIYGKDLD